MSVLRRTRQTAEGLGSAAVPVIEVAARDLQQGMTYVVTGRVVHSKRVARGRVWVRWGEETTVRGRRVTIVHEASYRPDTVLRVLA